MSNPYEFTPAQSFIPALRGDGPVIFGRPLWTGWREPTCQANDRRILDLATVPRLGDKAFRAELDSSVVALPEPWRAPEQHAPGSPIQPAHPTNTVLVEERHPRGWYRPRDLDLPAPADGHLWISGNPFPASRMRASIYDRHARLIAADGSTIEFYGAEAHYSWGKLVKITCQAVARWTPDGILDPDDRPVTKTTEWATSMLLRRGDIPHRLALVVAGTDDEEDTLDEIGRWVGLPFDAVPWDDLTPDMRPVAEALVHCGAVVIDHGLHSAVGVVADGAWQGVNWGDWRPTLGDFRAVVEA